ncbi:MULTISPECIES: type IV pilus assembly protein PilM [unclassified Curtobacterium]|uniref:type IV pilus assembly protein PilM n=1 Tax=unclassified Curtobacterium TaxID=257496 RepID=UPI000DA80F4D|nr:MULTISPECIES: type IV pilus assembly protein PilM [unclassified Curtobacterium]PZE28153.1 pilus assembly protein PilM [Curtobacterium sp. MCBD17_028]PZF62234.1 pilus assembly protein PilM [Curtobacterium sp. MCBD17_034]PZF63887.1 pilus assembly protein PilM [Curtobacterium sp. MCBD17_013]PZM40059.1 pilus assembly protein PilM [Curtobacterium sp. MCBD17_031]WIB63853.1 type IV pilus assembly protein PilM [Curtobacterium sp. MCBD17_040]
MAKSIVGLDIAAASIRAVEVASADRGRPTVVRFAEVPTPEGSVSRGEVLEANTVAGALKQLWSLGKFRSRDVVLGMGNQRVLSRDLTVPLAPIEQIRESLPFQVQDMLPVPVIDAILDFYPTSEGMGENGPVVRGLLIAAIKDAVLANVKAVQLAGLNPAGVDLIPFALTRALVSRPGLVGTVALIEIGADTTSVVIATDGVPQFVRIIPAGGADVTRALSGQLDIAADDAEAVKRHLGIAAVAQTADDRRAIAVTHETITEVLASLRNTINYFVNTHPDQPVGHILIAGGGARMRGFREALADYTRIPVSYGQAFGGVALAGSISEQDVAERGDAITVAFGLAVGSRAA